MSIMIFLFDFYICILEFLREKVIWKSWSVYVSYKENNYKLGCVLDVSCIGFNKINNILKVLDL